jgi:hypothetical protein
MATHSKTETRIIPKEELVIVRPHFWPPRHTSEPPAIEFSSKGGKLCRLEILRKNLGSKLLLLVDDEGTSVWQP